MDAKSAQKAFASFHFKDLSDPLKFYSFAVDMPDLGQYDQAMKLVIAIRGNTLAGFPTDFPLQGMTAKKWKANRLS